MSAVWVAFFCGMVVGAAVMTVVLGLCKVAGEADDQVQRADTAHYMLNYTDAPAVKYRAVLDKKRPVC